MQIYLVVLPEKSVTERTFPREIRNPRFNLSRFLVFWNSQTSKRLFFSIRKGPAACRTSPRPKDQRSANTKRTLGRAHSVRKRRYPDRRGHLFEETAYPDRLGKISRRNCGYADRLGRISRENRGTQIVYAIFLEKARVRR